MPSPGFPSRDHSGHYVDIVDALCFLWAARFYMIVCCLVGLLASTVQYRLTYRSDYYTSLPVTFETTWDTRVEGELSAFYSKLLSNPKDASAVYEAVVMSSPEIARIFEAHHISKFAFVAAQSSPSAASKTSIRLAKAEGLNTFNLDVRLPEADNDGNINRKIVSAVNQVAAAKGTEISRRFARFGADESESDLARDSAHADMSTLLNRIWRRKIRDEAKIRTAIAELEARLKIELVRANRVDDVRAAVIQPGDRPIDGYVLQLLGTLLNARLLSQDEANRIQNRYAELQVQLVSLNSAFETLLHQEDIKFLGNFMIPTHGAQPGLSSPIPLLQIDKEALRDRIESGGFMAKSHKSPFLILIGGLLGLLIGVVLYSMVLFFNTNRARLATLLQSA